MGCAGSKADQAVAPAASPPVQASTQPQAGAPQPAVPQQPKTEEVPPSAKKTFTDAEILELRRLTPAQEQAAQYAKDHITKVYNEMKKVPHKEHEQHWAKISDNKTVSWDFFRGNLIEDVMKHTPLIDIEYIVTLVEAGGVMPCGLQNVPKEAVITVGDNLWRLKCWNKEERKFCLGVLVFSYPWLDFYHPDRNGAQLTRILPFLKSMMAECKKDSKYGTIGVMIDFLCLPQKPFSHPSQKDQVCDLLRVPLRLPWPRLS